jgi:hypothetical protein
MPASEFLEWFTYYRLTSFGDETERQGFGLLAAMVANLFNSGRAKQPKDFMNDPFYEEPKMTWQQAKAAFQAGFPFKEGRYNRETGQAEYLDKDGNYQRIVS